MKKIAIGVRDLPVRTKQPNQIDIEVGSRIRLQRHLKGISQVAFGEALGVTFQQVQKYEKGTNRVSASRLSDVARILGQPVSYFFGNEQGQHNVDQETGDVAQFVGSGEGLALNRYYTRITDARVRRKFLALVTTLADADLADSK
ncbi:helix-turn-helix transcriptional regulator [Agrobacterium sp. GD03638]|uniref:helix-turn-helix domain-containing protein n=1 Tax=Agrobacterium sp. GD03638 TaxID=2975353 RepID=UPI001CC17E95|nr:helix-turn-helix transcriptional regulator [Agrobacterium sp. GD03638]MBZ4138364.1 helix-turn-helix transcriptional regulator [Escherichia fergusonii]MCW5796374.1 helix-turn-helix transcriptional regulator [Nitrospira sp.]MCW5886583.1 helix-turn-helix transcriptional regulator [Anaerolineales bacterium]MDH2221570.1 helix-turn-helix domain-containing protein [Agrobacterium sp. GD03638]